MSGATGLPAPPLQLLDDALAAGTARFGSRKVVAAIPVTSAGGRRLRAKLAALSRALPEVRVGERVLAHEGGGLVYADLDLGTSRYLVGCGRFSARILSPEVPVDIVTGICLYGSDAAVACVGGDLYSLTYPRSITGQIRSRIDGLVLDERLHVYEAETLARLTSFIRDLSAQLRAPVRVHVHAPVPEYELYGLSLYASGYLAGGLYEGYRRAVRRRGRLLSAMLQDRLPRPAFDVRVTSPLRWMHAIDVLSAAPGDIAGLLHDGARQQDPLWRDLVGGIERQPLQALAFASYVHHYLATAREVQRWGGQLVVVENPEEAIIHSSALLARDRTGMSMDGTIGFYVHPQVVVREIAFRDQGHILYNCKDGCNPSTVEFATSQYGLRGSSTDIPSR
jgi:hypothetical protein